MASVAKDSKKKKRPASVSTEVPDRIVEAALAHPNLGADRLTRLLSDEGVKVSRGLVYRALRAKGLHTKQLRSQFLEKRARVEKPADTRKPEKAPEPARKPLREQSQESPGAPTLEYPAAPAPTPAEEEPASVPANLTERVVAAALAHPTFGVDRVTRLLSDEGVAVTRGLVYRTLRHAGLQTRQLRIRFLEKQARLEKPADSEEPKEAPGPSPEPFQELPRETPGPPVSIPGIEYAASPAPALKEDKPEVSVGVLPAQIAAPAAAPPIEKIEKALPGKEKWLFMGINLLLAAIIVLLAVSIGIRIYDARQEPIAAAVSPSGSDSAVEAAETPEPDRPLGNYRVILDRNLFGAESHPASDPAREAADLKAIGLAGNEVGLKLIGTAVGKDRRKNYAVLEVVKTGSQQISREKDVVANVTIKRILRNNVIISTASGEKRLSVDDKLSGGTAASLVQPAAAAMSFSGVPQVDAGSMDMTHEISRNEIDQSLPEVRQMLEESNSSAKITEGKPDGFSLGRLRARDAFFRIGLRTGDVIKSVDGQAVDTPEDAELLLERMTEGGNFSILVERGGQLQSLHLSVK